MKITEFPGPVLVEKPCLGEIINAHDEKKDGKTS